jgi:hypothetical protein
MSSSIGSKKGINKKNIIFAVMLLGEEFFYHAAIKKVLHEQAQCFFR